MLTLSEEERGRTEDAKKLVILTLSEVERGRTEGAKKLSL